MEFRELSNQGEKTLKSIINWAIYFLSVIMIILFLTTYVITLFIVDGKSMEKTLKDGQIIAVRRTTNVQAGDIVVFPFDAYDNGNEIILVKRVIAVGGEKVSLVGSNIIVEAKDGAKRVAFEGFHSYLESVTVKDGCFYAMGDNFHLSQDSTEFGVVPIEAIIGRVLFQKKQEYIMVS